MMNAKPLWSDPISLAYLWPPILLAWILALYHMSSSLEPIVWIVLTVILVLMIVSMVWLVVDRLRMNQAKPLPWYLVMGPPQAGKATLLRNAGIVEAPMTGRTTPHVDPYFASHTIVAAGLGTFVLYREEEVDQPTQQALVSHAASFMRGKPWKGTLVTIDVDTLLDGGAIPQAQALREHLHQLIDRLGANVPVYVVVTKCDHLNGFAAFFAGMTALEQAYGWGATLGGDQQGDPGAALAAECQTLHRALDDRRLECLGRGAVGANGETYRFPMEFSAMCLQLRAFVDELFAASRSRSDNRLMFRGFYFTGVRQQPSSNAPCGYFVADVVTKIIGGGQHLAQPTARAIRRVWWWRMAFLVAAFVASAAMLAPVVGPV